MQRRPPAELPHVSARAVVGDVLAEEHGQSLADRPLSPAARRARLEDGQPRADGAGRPAPGGRGPASSGVVLPWGQRSGPVVARLLDGPAQADQPAGGGGGLMAGGRSMVKSIGRQWGVTIVTIVMTFILTPFIIHRLGTEAYGTRAPVTAMRGEPRRTGLGVAT